MKISSSLLIPVAGRSPADYPDEGAVLASLRLPDAPTESGKAAIKAKIRNYLMGTFLGKPIVKPSHQPMALHTHGARGSGKSMWINGSFKEHNSEFALIGDRVERVHPNHGDAINVARGLAYNRAIQMRCNIASDVSGTSADMVGLMEQLRAHGFKNEIVTFFTPYEIAKSRLMKRDGKKFSKEAVIADRIAVYNSLRPLMDSTSLNGEDFAALWNANRNCEASVVFQFESGKLTEVEPRVIGLMLESIKEDLEHPDLQGNEALRSASHAAYSFLHKIAVTRPVYLPAPRRLDECAPHR